MPDTSRPILILGASRGIGLAAAEALAARGFPVALGCRKPADAQAAAARLAETGAQALPLTVDVTDFAAVEAAVAATCDWKGALGGLVNNAGIIEPIGRLAETDPAAWAHLIQVNLTGAYHGLRAALPRLARGGAVVNISSGAASAPMEGWSAYCASKAGMAMLTRSVHHEYGAEGVRCYGFRPGVVDTGMQVSIRASGINPVSQLPRESLAPPEVPAAGIAWLIAEAPEDLSGQEVDIRDETFLARMNA
ncbi:SDR family oxidoreductase [Frigidibacter sp. ROC022]|uniref:SDR family oxidoreductase n=1 Tax=Frigidibacter sp. ROC022 TaxID=2971796 RepID=UPI00215B4036|nr:SDR family oxidoreductase [Frigidibacter sp. ROC022]MCR8726184.1 SDR family oxidoreductase [Frigidibacter sp. ROC022]